MKSVGASTNQLPVKRSIDRFPKCFLPGFCVGHNAKQILFNAF
jgi:hypothetical protein